MASDHSDAEAFEQLQGVRAAIEALTPEEITAVGIFADVFRRIIQSDEAAEYGFVLVAAEYAVATYKAAAQ